MKIRIAAIAFAIAAAFSAPAGAATVGLQVDRSLGLQVYALGGDRFIGLWRFNTRDRIDPDDTDNTLNSAADLRAGFRDDHEDNVLGFYTGDIPLFGEQNRFTPFVFPTTIPENTIVRRAIWVEFTGPFIVYNQPNERGRARMNSRNARQGFDIALVPTPAALPLLLAGLGAFGLIARRRKAA